MRYLLILATALWLTGCEVAPVKNVQEVKTKTQISSKITLPVTIPVAYYASSEELERIYEGESGYYRWAYPTGARFKEALELVVPGVFEDAEKLQLGSNPHYLLKFTSTPNYDSVWGNYEVKLTTQVIDRSGNEVFKTDSKGSASSGNDGGAGYTNAYASALKEAINRFINHLGAEQIASIQSQPAPEALNSNNIKALLKEIKPVGTGSGFYINTEGQLLTASHVVQGCLLTQVRLGDKTTDTSLVAQSRILDLAVLQAEPTETFAQIGSEGSIQLGEQVFTTSYPLSNILTSQANLTLGNVSSMGGLKGAFSNFQYSAPIQPGSSGGPIIDYQGNINGVVTSTLNQAYILATTGTTAQNINFGVANRYVLDFLNNNQISYSSGEVAKDFSQATERAVEYTAQVFVTSKDTGHETTTFRLKRCPADTVQSAHQCRNYRHFP